MFLLYLIWYVPLFSVHLTICTEKTCTRVLVYQKQKIDMNHSVYYFSWYISSHVPKMTRILGTQQEMYNKNGTLSLFMIRVPRTVGVPFLLYVLLVHCLRVPQKVLIFGTRTTFLVHSIFAGHWPSNFSQRTLFDATWMRNTKQFRKIPPIQNVNRSVGAAVLLVDG